jgi:hypothetical protein
MRAFLILMMAAAAPAGAACSKEETTEANPQGAGEGIAYNPATGTTTQAEATSGPCAPARSTPSPQPLNPTATTGGAAGGVTKTPPTAPETPRLQAAPGIGVLDAIEDRPVGGQVMAEGHGAGGAARRPRAPRLSPGPASAGPCRAASRGRRWWRLSCSFLPLATPISSLARPLSFQ